MPIYCYNCKDCSHEFEVRHSMVFEDQACLSCKSKNVFKVPSLNTTRVSPASPRVGKIVDDYIEETKSLIKAEKKNLKKEVL